MSGLRIDRRVELSPHPSLRWFLQMTDVNLETRIVDDAVLSAATAATW
jgi:hypothetical protein